MTILNYLFAFKVPWSLVLPIKALVILPRSTVLDKKIGHWWICSNQKLSWTKSMHTENMAWSANSVQIQRYNNFSVKMISLRSVNFTKFLQRCLEMQLMWKNEKFSATQNFSRQINYVVKFFDFTGFLWQWQRQ